MRFNDSVRFRTRSELVEDVDDIVDRTGFDRSEVLRRLVRLGLEDIDQIGDEALLVAAPNSDSERQSVK